MKAKPNSQKAASGRGEAKGKCFLHGAEEPELDTNQVRRRADRLSGVLSQILKRKDSPEHYEFRE